MGLPKWSVSIWGYQLLAISAQRLEQGKGLFGGPGAVAEFVLLFHWELGEGPVMGGDIEDLSLIHI